MNFLHLAQSLNPFMDDAGDTYIQVKIEGEEDETKQIPADTALAQNIIKAELCSHVKRGYPTDHDTRIATAVIIGHAFKEPRQEAQFSTDYRIARKPLAQTVLAVAQKGGTEKDPRSLLAMLTNVATQEGIDITNCSWPRNPDSLGKQLSQIINLVKQKGVDLIRHGNERPRKWTISFLEKPSDGSDDKVTDLNREEKRNYDNADTSSCTDSCTDDQIDQLLKTEEIDASQ